MDFFYQWHRSIPHYHEMVLWVEYAISWLAHHRP